MTLTARDVWRHRFVASEAVAALVAAKVLRVMLNVAHWESAIGRKGGVGDREFDQVLPPKGTDRSVSLAVAAAARRLPFSTNCFDQALAARWMLKRRGSASTVVFGLRRGALGDGSHAWVVGESGGTVTGGSVAQEFVAVAAFR